MRKTVHNTPEADTQIEFFSIVRRYAQHYTELAMLFSVPNERKMTPRQGARLNALGRSAGVPDVFCAVPKAPYAGYFIEFKSPVGKQTTEQIDWATRLQYQGYKYEVHRTWYTAWNSLVCYLQLPVTLLVT